MVAAASCLLAVSLVAWDSCPGRPQSSLEFARDWSPRLLAQVEPPVDTTDSPTSLPAQKGKLDRRTKIELLFVLVMLVAVGLGLIAFTWFTARLTRRYMKPAEKLPARRPDPVFTDDWAAKPLTPDERAKLDSEEW